MDAPARLGVFAAGLAVIFGASFAVGAVVGSAGPTAPDPPSPTTVARSESDHAGTHP